MSRRRAAVAAEPRRIDYLLLSELRPAEVNPKDHDAAALRASIERFGLIEVAAVMDERTGRLISGHGRLDDLRAAELAELDAPDGITVDGDGRWLAPVLRGWASADDAEAEAALVAVNETTISGGWRPSELTPMLERIAATRRGIEGTGFTADRLADLQRRLADARQSESDADDERARAETPSLADRFGVPPFSVLDTRQGYWQDRRRAWLSLGIESEVGRENHLLAYSRAARLQVGAPSGPVDGDQPATSFAERGTSVFDPVLCELVYRWWARPGARVLDPFAGGSVRGIVAAALGLDYHGIELRGEQVEANRAQLDQISSERELTGHPMWTQGDSALLLSELDVEPFDLLFTCPPYHTLEAYSDEPGDLSAIEDYDQFAAQLALIMRDAAARLADDRYAVVVVGEIRDKRGPGWLRGLVGTTIDACEQAGLHYLNDAILLNAVGSTALRVPHTFPPARKLGRVHQYVLVFAKGDPRAAAAWCGPIEATLDVSGDAGDEYATGETFEDVPVELLSDPHAMTPIEQRGDVWVKRDDLFGVGSSRGGKVRTALAIGSQEGALGLITAGGRQSPQVNIVAEVAQLLGLPCRVHVPSGRFTPELVAAQEHGAEVVQHNYGRQSVIGARARQDAESSPGWVEVPFGMECQQAVDLTAAQVQNLPDGVARIVIPVGSSMSLAGVVTGLERYDVDLPVLAVSVVGIPTLERRMDRWAPADWRERVEVVKSDVPYHVPAPSQSLDGLRLDPIYEAKCLPYLRSGDLLWVVGLRGSLHR